MTFVGLFIEPHSNVAWQPCAQTAVAESFAAPDKNVRLADEWAIVSRLINFFFFPVCGASAGEDMWFVRAQAKKIESRGG